MRKILCAATMVAALATGACGDDDDATDPTPDDPSMLVDQQITVPANGGSANVFFTTTAGQRVRITLVASPTTVLGAAVPSEPYGSLENPSGSSADHPPLASVANNQNTEDLTLPESGRYKLTVFDGSNAGRSVHVTVQKIQ